MTHPEHLCPSAYLQVSTITAMSTTLCHHCRIAILENFSQVAIMAYRHHSALAIQSWLGKLYYCTFYNPKNYGSRTTGQKIELCLSEWRSKRKRFWHGSPFGLGFAGPAAALLTLAVWRDIEISMAVALLVAAAGLQAFAYAGFHSYAQDVCPKVRSFSRRYIP